MCGSAFNDASSYRASEAPVSRKVQREVLTDHPVSMKSKKRDPVTCWKWDRKITDGRIEPLLPFQVSRTSLCPSHRCRLPRGSYSERAHRRGHAFRDPLSSSGGGAG
jgi:hypothetical protein